MSNPYAPPGAAVGDIVDPSAEIVPASRGVRLGAAMLDGIVFGAMVYLPMLFGLLLQSAVADPGGSAPLLVGSLLALVGLVAWSWLTIRFVKRNGQSIGKKLLNIKVVRTDGSPISLGRLFWLRNVVNVLLGIVPFYGLIDILFIFGESRQCLHDKLADTTVAQA